MRAGEESLGAVDTRRSDDFRRSVDRFVEARSPLGRMRALRDNRDAVGFSWALWREMAELGWLGAHYPEADGGAGARFQDVCAVLEAAGRRLMPEPLLPALLLGGETLVQGVGQGGAGPALAQHWVPRLIAGEAVVTLAF